MSINNNFYSVVNSLVSQAAGNAIAITDHNSFVDFGKQLDGINGTEIANNFLAALANRIAQVVELYRGYEGDYADLYRGNIEYGQTIEQIMYNWYESNAAGWTQLNDGETFGTYTIAKPQIKVNFFEKENAYDIEKTIQFEMLKKAFTSETELNNFMSGIFGMFTNSNERIREEARIGMISSRIAAVVPPLIEMDATAKSSDSMSPVYDLRKCYANDTGDASLNTKPIEVLLHNENFVKYAMATIKKIKKKMTKPTRYFSGTTTGVETFTPENAQNTYLAAGLKTAIDSYIINTAHYADGASVLNLDAKSVAYWQAAKSPYKVLSGTSDSDKKEIDGVIGIVFDDWSCGEYTSVQTMDISPYDAKRRCWQYIFHGLCRYVVNADANFVVFLISAPTA